MIHVLAAAPSNGGMGNGIGFIAVLTFVALCILGGKKATENKANPFQGSPFGCLVMVLAAGIGILLIVPGNIGWL